MILYINTTPKEYMEVGLKEGGEILVLEKITVERTQAEKLLPAVENILKKRKIKAKDLEKIEVENRGGSFTSLRIGVVTANALGYSLGIPVIESRTGQCPVPTSGFNVVLPKYSGEPDIR